MPLIDFRSRCTDTRRFGSIAAPSCQLAVASLPSTPVGGAATAVAAARGEGSHRPGVVPGAGATVSNFIAYGEAMPSAETGMLFPTMEAIAGSHGWTVHIDPTYQGGVRIEIGGVETCDAPG